MSDTQNKIEALRKAIADIHTKMGGPPPPPEKLGCCTIEFMGKIIPLGMVYEEQCQGDGETFHHNTECGDVPGVIPPFNPTPKPKPKPKPGLPFRNFRN